MAKYGGNSVGWILIDGYDIVGNSTIEEADMPDPEAVTQETHGLGSSWFEFLATGLRKATAKITGLFDDVTGGINEALVGNTAVQRVICWNVTGNAVGNKFTGAAGGFVYKFQRSFGRAKLIGATGEMTITGAVEEGVILQHLTAKTVDWDTEGAESQDAGASSASGASGYQQVKLFSGFTGFVGKIRHSSDDVTYADLITFANVTAANNGQRVTVAGTVNRHTAYKGDVTGTGSITVMGGLARG